MLSKTSQIFSNERNSTVFSRPDLRQVSFIQLLKREAVSGSI